MKIREIFYTLQGEGAHAGRAAVFVRFAGCNGWSGKPADRAKGPLPCSRWCDTDFVGGRSMTESDVVEYADSLFVGRAHRMAVITGGEPALQVTDSFLKKMLERFSCVAIETNGSLPLPETALSHCWVTVSPKTGLVVQDKASEIKLIYPTIAPEKFDYITAFWRFLQPLDNAERMKNTDAAIEYIKRNPQWRLSVQTQKYAGFQ
jgi:7-carboxy-7-deazaguanine synthase